MKTKKLIALILSLCFLVGETTAYGALPLTNPLQSIPELGLSVPKKFGTVDEVYTSPQTTNKSPQKTIIFIQDAHDSLEAQENIANLIHHFQTQHQVNAVFEEGYQGKVPTEKYFGEIEDPKVRERVAYFLMDKLRLGGAEYAHIQTPHAFELIGVDSQSLYQENLDWYKKSSVQKEMVATQLEEVEDELKSVILKEFPRPMKQWVKLKERFGSGQLDLLSYLRRFVALVKKSDTPFTKNTYPNLDLLTSWNLFQATAQPDLSELDAKLIFVELENLEKNFSFQALQREDLRSLFRSFQDLQLIKRLNTLQVSSSEFEAIQYRVQRLSVRELARQIAQIRKEPVAFLDLWQSQIQAAIRFYETANARDLAVESQLRQRGERTSVLVFGGFHKNKITQLLKRNQFSYAVITPKISSMSKKHQEYYHQLMKTGLHPYEVQSVVAQSTRAPNQHGVWDDQPFAVARSEVNRLQEAARKTLGQSLSTALFNIEQELLNNKSNQALTRSEVRYQTDEKRVLMMTDQPDALDQQLFDQAQREGKAYARWRVGNDAELRRLKYALEVKDDGSTRLLDGDLRRAMKEKGIVYLDATEAKVNSIEGHNSIFDDEPFWEDLKNLEDVQVYVSVPPGRMDDFANTLYSRSFVVSDKRAGVGIFVDPLSELQEKTLDEDAEIGDALVVDLKKSPDYRAKLIGRPTVDHETGKTIYLGEGQEVRGRPHGVLVKAIKEGKPLVIQGMDWKNDDLTYLLRQLLVKKEISANGERVKITDNGFQILFQKKDYSVGVEHKKLIRPEPITDDQEFYVINTLTQKSLFSQSEINIEGERGILVEAPGLLERPEAIRLRITETVSDGIWHEIMHTDAIVEVEVAEGVFIPPVYQSLTNFKVRTTPIRSDGKVRIVEGQDLAFIRENIKKAVGEESTIFYPLGPQTRSSQLIEDINFSEQDGERDFETTAQALLLALEEGKNFVLEGIQNSPLLLKRLEGLLVEKPYLVINGRHRYLSEFPGTLFLTIKKLPRQGYLYDSSMKVEVENPIEDYQKILEREFKGSFTEKNYKKILELFERFKSIPHPRTRGNNVNYPSELNLSLSRLRVFYRLYREFGNWHEAFKHTWMVHYRSDPEVMAYMSVQVKLAFGQQELGRKGDDINGRGLQKLLSQMVDDSDWPHFYWQFHNLFGLESLFSLQVNKSIPDNFSDDRILHTTLVTERVIVGQTIIHRGLKLIQKALVKSNLSKSKNPYLSREQFLRERFNLGPEDVKDAPDIDEKSEWTFYTPEQRIELIRRVAKANPLVFLQGPPGRGKSYLLKALAESLGFKNQQELQKEIFGPFTTGADVKEAQINSRKVERDGKTIDELGLVGEWLQSERGILLWDEANLADSNFHDFLRGKQSENHVAVLTGNDESTEGRNRINWVSEEGVMIWFDEFEDEFLQKQVRRYVKNLGEGHREVAELVWELHGIFSKMNPDLEFSIRELQEVSNRLVHKKVATDNKDAIIFEAWLVYRGRFDEVEKIALQALLQQKFGVSLEIDEANRLDRLTEEQRNFFESNGIALTPETIDYIVSVYEMLDLREGRMSGEFAEPGKTSSIIFGPSGWGKDAILSLILEQRKVKHYLLNASMNYKELEKTIIRAKKEGAIVSVRELDFLKTGILEGKLNDLLTGEADPGFLFFGTLNGKDFKGRRHRLSSPFLSRSWVYNVTPHNRKSWEMISEAYVQHRNLQVKSEDIEKLVDFQSKLTEQIEDRQYHPTTRELFRSLRMLHAGEKNWNEVIEDVYGSVFLDWQLKGKTISSILASSTSVEVKRDPALNKIIDYYLRDKFGSYTFTWNKKDARSQLDNDKRQVIVSTRTIQEGNTIKKLLSTIASLLFIRSIMGESLSQDGDSLVENIFRAAFGDEEALENMNQAQSKNYLQQDLISFWIMRSLKQFFPSIPFSSMSARKEGMARIVRAKDIHAFSQFVMPDEGKSLNARQVFRDILIAYGEDHLSLKEIEAFAELVDDIDYIFPQNPFRYARRVIPQMFRIRQEAIQTLDDEEIKLKGWQVAQLINEIAIVFDEIALPPLHESKDDVRRRMADAGDDIDQDELAQKLLQAGKADALDPEVIKRKSEEAKQRAFERLVRDIEQELDKIENSLDTKHVMLSRLQEMESQLTDPRYRAHPIRAWLDNLQQSFDQDESRKEKIGELEARVRELLVTIRELIEIRKEQEKGNLLLGLRDTRPPEDALYQSLIADADEDVVTDPLTADDLEVVGSVGFKEVTIEMKDMEPESKEDQRYQKIVQHYRSVLEEKAFELFDVFSDAGDVVAIDGDIDMQTYLESAGNLEESMRDIGEVYHREPRDLVLVEGGELSPLREAILGFLLELDFSFHVVSDESNFVFKITKKDGLPFLKAALAKVRKKSGVDRNLIKETMKSHRHVKAEFEIFTLDELQQKVEAAYIYGAYKLQHDQIEVDKSELDDQESEESKVDLERLNQEYQALLERIKSTRISPSQIEKNEEKGFLRIDFSGMKMSSIDLRLLNSLQQYSYLKKVHFVGVKLNNWEFLRKAIQLETIMLTDSNFNDLSILKGPSNLRHLILRGVSGITADDLEEAPEGEVGMKVELDSGTFENVVIKDRERVDSDEVSWQMGEVREILEESLGSPKGIEIFTSEGGFGLQLSSLTNEIPLEKLAPFPALKSIRFEGVQMNNWADLSKLKTVESLTIADSNFHDFSAISNLDRLEDFKLFDSQKEMNYLNLMDLPQLKSLKSLTLAGVQYSNWSSLIPRLSHLKLLSLRDTNFDEEVLIFKDFKNLEYLVLMGTSSISSDDFEKVPDGQEGMRVHLDSGVLKNVVIKDRDKVDPDELEGEYQALLVLARRRGIPESNVIKHEDGLEIKLSGVWPTNIINDLELFQYLKILRLRDYDLDDWTFLSNLENLEMLVMVDTNFSELPLLKGLKRIKELRFIGVEAISEDDFEMAPDGEEGITVRLSEESGADLVNVVIKSAEEKEGEDLLLRQEYQDLQSLLSRAGVPKAYERGIIDTEKGILMLDLSTLDLVSGGYDLRGLNVFTRLEYVYLKGATLPDLNFLEGIPNLRHLDLESIVFLDESQGLQVTPLNNEIMRTHSEFFNRLEFLRLKGTAVTDEVIAVSKVKGEGVYIEFGGDGDDFQYSADSVILPPEETEPMATFGEEFKRLRELLESWGLQPDRVVPDRTAPYSKIRVDLNNVNFNDFPNIDLDQLKHFNRIRELSLVNADLRSGDLSFFSSMKPPENLILRGVKFEDGRSLGNQDVTNPDHAKFLNQVKRLDIRETDVTENVLVAGENAILVGDLHDHNMKMNVRIQAWDEAQEFDDSYIFSEEAQIIGQLMNELTRLANELVEEREHPNGNVPGRAKASLEHILEVYKVGLDGRNVREALQASNLADQKAILTSIYLFLRNAEIVSHDFELFLSESASGGLNVNLQGAQINNEHLKLFAPLTWITHLSLRGTEVDNIQVLHTLDRLEELNIRDVSGIMNDQLEEDLTSKLKIILNNPNAPTFSTTIDGFRIKPPEDVRQESLSDDAPEDSEDSEVQLFDIKKIISYFREVSQIENLSSEMAQTELEKFIASFETTKNGRIIEEASIREQHNLLVVLVKLMTVADVFSPTDTKSAESRIRIEAQGIVADLGNSQMTNEYLGLLTPFSEIYKIELDWTLVNNIQILSALPKLEEINIRHTAVNFQEQFAPDSSSKLIVKRNSNDNRFIQTPGYRIKLVSQEANEAVLQMHELFKVVQKWVRSGLAISPGDPFVSSKIASNQNELHLDFSGVPLTNEHLLDLLQFDRITRINLSGTRIKNVQVLHGMPWLRQLDVSQTEVVFEEQFEKDESSSLHVIGQYEGVDVVKYNVLARIKPPSEPAPEEELHLQNNHAQMLSLIDRYTSKYRSYNDPDVPFLDLILQDLYGGNDHLRTVIAAASLEDQSRLLATFLLALDTTSSEVTTVQHMAEGIHVYLQKSSITNESLEILAPFTWITDLDLSDTNVTNIQVLAPLERLTSLKLHRLRVDMDQFVIAKGSPLEIHLTRFNRDIIEQGYRIRPLEESVPSLDEDMDVIQPTESDALDEILDALKKIEAEVITVVDDRTLMVDIDYRNRLMSSVRRIGDVLNDPENRDFFEQESIVDEQYEVLVEVLDMLVFMDFGRDVSELPEDVEYFIGKVMTEDGETIKLELDSWKIDDEHLRLLAPFTWISSLSLKGTGVTNIQDLASLKRLTDFNVDQTDIDISQFQLDTENPIGTITVQGESYSGAFRILRPGEGKEKPSENSQSEINDFAAFMSHLQSSLLRLENIRGDRMPEEFQSWAASTFNTILDQVGKDNLRVIMEKTDLQRQNDALNLLVEILAHAMGRKVIPETVTVSHEDGGSLSLNIAGWDITDDQLEIFSYFDMITRITLAGAQRVTNIQAFAALPRLELINVEFTGVDFEKQFEPSPQGTLTSIRYGQQKHEQTPYRIIPPGEEKTSQDQGELSIDLITDELRKRLDEYTLRISRADSGAEHQLILVQIMNHLYDFIKDDYELIRRASVDEQYELLQVIIKILALTTKVANPDYVLRKVTLNGVDMISVNLKESEILDDHLEIFAPFIHIGGIDLRETYVTNIQALAPLKLLKSMMLPQQMVGLSGQVREVDYSTNLNVIIYGANQGLRGNLEIIPLDEETTSQDQGEKSASTMVTSFKDIFVRYEWMLKEAKEKHIQVIQKTILRHLNRFVEEEFERIQTFSIDEQYQILKVMVDMIGLTGINFSSKAITQLIPSDDREFDVIQEGIAVDFSGLPIEDHHLKLLTPFTHISILNLNKTEVTNVQELVTITDLNMLLIRETNVSIQAQFRAVRDDTEQHVSTVIYGSAEISENASLKIIPPSADRETLGDQIAWDDFTRRIRMTNFSLQQVAADQALAAEAIRSSIDDLSNEKIFKRIQNLTFEEQKEMLEQIIILLRHSERSGFIPVLNNDPLPAVAGLAIYFQNWPLKDVHLKLIAPFNWITVLDLEDTEVTNVQVLTSLNRLRDINVQNTEVDFDQNFRQTSYETPLKRIVVGKPGKIRNAFHEIIPPGEEVESHSDTIGEKFYQELQQLARKIKVARGASAKHEANMQAIAYLERELVMNKVLVEVIHESSLDFQLRLLEEVAEIFDTEIDVPLDGSDGIIFDVLPKADYFEEDHLKLLLPFTHIKHVVLSNIERIKNVQVLAAHPNLEKIDIQGTGVVFEENFRPAESVNALEGVWYTKDGKSQEALRSHEIIPPGEEVSQPVEVEDTDDQMTMIMEVIETLLNDLLKSEEPRQEKIASYLQPVEALLKERNTQRLIAAANVDDQYNLLYQYIGMLENLFDPDHRFNIVESLKVAEDKTKNMFPSGRGIHLDLSSLPMINDEHLEILSAFSHIVILNLKDTRVRNVQVLASLEELVSLNVAGTNVDFDSQFRIVTGRETVLRVVDYGNQQFTGSIEIIPPGEETQADRRKDVARVLESLNKLVVSDEYRGHERIAFLKDLMTSQDVVSVISSSSIEEQEEMLGFVLAVLSLSGIHLNNENVLKISITNERNQTQSGLALNLSNSGIEDQHLAFFAPFTHILDIDVSNSKVKNVQVLAPLKQIDKINIANTEVDFEAQFRKVGVGQGMQVRYEDDVKTTAYNYEIIPPEQLPVRFESDETEFQTMKDLMKNVNERMAAVDGRYGEISRDESQKHVDSILSILKNQANQKLISEASAPDQYSVLYAFYHSWILHYKFPFKNASEFLELSDSNGIELRLNQWGIHDDDLKYLAAFTHITHLDLSETKVTNVQVLASLTRLLQINVRKTKVDADYANQFEVSDSSTRVMEVIHNDGVSTGTIEIIPPEEEQESDMRRDMDWKNFLMTVEKLEQLIQKGPGDSSDDYKNFEKQVQRGLSVFKKSLKAGDSDIAKRIQNSEADSQFSILVVLVDLLNASGIKPNGQMEVDGTPEGGIELHLADSNIRDEHLPLFAPFTWITEFNLKNTKVTNVQVLASLSRLESFNIENTKVDFKTQFRRLTTVGGGITVHRTDDDGEVALSDDVEIIPLEEESRLKEMDSFLDLLQRNVEDRDESHILKDEAYRSLIEIFSSLKPDAVEIRNQIQSASFDKQYGLLWKIITILDKVGLSPENPAVALGENSNRKGMVVNLSNWMITDVDLFIFAPFTWITELNLSNTKVKNVQVLASLHRLKRLVVPSSIKIRGGDQFIEDPTSLLTIEHILGDGESGEFFPIQGYRIKPLVSEVADIEVDKEFIESLLEEMVDREEALEYVWKRFVAEGNSDWLRENFNEEFGHRSEVRLVANLDVAVEVIKVHHRIQSLKQPTAFVLSAAALPYLNEAQRLEYAQLMVENKKITLSVVGFSDLSFEDRKWVEQMQADFGQARVLSFESADSKGFQSHVRFKERVILLNHQRSEVQWVEPKLAFGRPVLRAEYLDAERGLPTMAALLPQDVYEQLQGDVFHVTRFGRLHSIVETYLKRLAFARSA